jgi:pyruvate/2-oxoglutarate dehydrogenase complex dihydrolipoamide dehydrogenase (E3) component
VTARDADSIRTDLIRPLDAHNLRHLANVHPASRANPVPGDRYHLVVIGAGPGGLVTAAAGAALGARVALVERHLMGGDCLNVGCVPSKAVLRAARAWHETRTGAGRFGAPPIAGPGDFAMVMERMRRLRADLGGADSVERFTKMGVDVFLGEGRFTGPDTAEVAGARLRFRRAVIATGARPALPPIPGLPEAAPFTNETIFSLTVLPPRLAVIGAGPVGCELAQAFARFGSRVTLLNRSDRVLPREDRDAARLVEEALARDGVELRLGAKLIEARRTGPETVLTLERGSRRDTVAADAVLVAAGRLPNLEGLDLERAGVAHDAQGVTVDHRLRTTNHRIYAIGDVCSRHKFTHAADAHARLVVRNALFFGRGRADRLVMPWCTYTSPEIAHVGMNETEARAAGIAVDTVGVPLGDLDRAVLDDATEGFVRVHLKPGTDRILGATLVADNAGDLIGELALAVTARVGLAAIGSTIHPYPTQGEIIRKAADAWQRRRLTPRARRAFDLFFRLFR